MIRPLLGRLGLRRRHDGSTHIRPGGALVLCVVVWLVCTATVLESFWLLGVDGWRFAVLPAAVSAVVWALLWAPRVVVDEEHIEVRNVLETRRLPMAAIDRVRLGAMLRFELVPAPGSDKPLVVTAWNAPGVGRDRPRERLAAMDPRARSSAAAARPDWAQRLRRDQLESPSHAAVEAWESWEARQEPGQEPVTQGAEATGAEPSRRVNAGVLVVLVAAVLAVAARSLL